MSLNHPPNHHFDRWYNSFPVMGGLWLWKTQIDYAKAIEHGTFIVDLPIQDGDFPQLFWFTRG